MESPLRTPSSMMPYIDLDARQLRKACFSIEYNLTLSFPYQLVPPFSVLDITLPYCTLSYPYLILISSRPARCMHNVRHTALGGKEGARDLSMSEHRNHPLEALVGMMPI